MVDAYRTSAVETGLRVARASDVEQGRAGLRADDVNWALETQPGKAERATDALELDIARRIDRAAALRYNIVGDEPVRAKVLGCLAGTGCKKPVN